MNPLEILLYNLTHDKIKLNENVPENEIWLVDFRYKGEKMNKFELNQEVKVSWPYWQEGNIGKIIDIYFTPQPYHIVEMGDGEKYGYWEDELEAVST